MAPANSRSVDSDTRIEQQQALLGQELGKAIFSHKTFAESLYKGQAWDDAVDAYLRSSTLRDADGWTQLPVKVEVAKEDELYPIYHKIIEEILASRTKATGQDIRQVHDTHAQLFAHQELDGRSLKSMPDITIAAQGPSFEKPDKGDVGYTNAATVIEIKKKSEAKPNQNLRQVAVYAR